MFYKEVLFYDVSTTTRMKYLYITSKNLTIKTGFFIRKLKMIGYVVKNRFF